MVSFLSTVTVDGACECVVVDVTPFITALFTILPYDNGFSVAVTVYTIFDPGAMSTVVFKLELLLNVPAVDMSAATTPDANDVVTLLASVN